ncbi:alpha/beta hydrolase family protein [Methylobacterium sp. JK268]
MVRMGGWCAFSGRVRIRRLLAASLIVGASAQAARPARSQSSPEDTPFDPAAVVRGIVIDREACRVLERAETAVWIVAGGRGACLRYYAAGLAPAPGPNSVAALWLNGDVLGGKGDNADKHQRGIGPRDMVEQERRLSARFGVPWIFLGRPGSYGSAGRHFTTRGRPIELDLVDAAIEALKARYGIRSWALGGHSGGGTLVAALLARRHDLRCGIISSGAAAYQAYLKAHGLDHGERLTRFDPAQALDAVPTDPGRRVFVIGDPRETNVVFSSQTLYYEGLVSRGHAARLVPLRRATDARHHGLVDFSETATGLCASGAATETIVRTLEAMPEQQPRITN